MKDMIFLAKRSVTNQLIIFMRHDFTNVVFFELEKNWDSFIWFVKTSFWNCFDQLSDL